MSAGFALCDDRWGTDISTLDYPGSHEDLSSGPWGCYVDVYRGASGLEGDFDASGFFNVSVWGVSLSSSIFSSFGPSFLSSVKELVNCGTWWASNEALQC